MSAEHGTEDALEFEAQDLAQPWVEPTYLSDTPKAAPVWAVSQQLRALLDRLKAGDLPTFEERRGLRGAVLRQLPSLGLYRELTILRHGPTSSSGKRDQDIGLNGTVGLYVLTFPGEAADNTGIKDLNDNVLGYELNSEWIAERQLAVAQVFWQPDSTPPPRWVTVGQDYKTAYIVPMGKSGKDFATDLKVLDGKLTDALLVVLCKAEAVAKEKKDHARLKAIADLRKRLKKNDVYRFPYTFGFCRQSLMSGKTLVLALRLITEALKAAAIVRWSDKRDQAKLKPLAGVSMPKPARGEDARGLRFDAPHFLDVYRSADRIKAYTRTTSNATTNVNFNITFINEVWAQVFVLHRRKPFANPDVIRDARKKLIVEPKLNRGVKVAFDVTVRLVEMFLVTLNLIDFVAGFLKSELPDVLEAYHDLALAILVDLGDPELPQPPAFKELDVERLTKFLTYDIAQKGPRTVLGAASEFAFYAYASDWMDQILFAMDIRDLGVELMSHYEIANEIVVDGKLRDDRLMQATLMAGDLTVDRKRYTYDTVVAVFRDHYKRLLQSSGASGAQRLFSPAPLRAGSLPDFDHSIQVMLGGDEVFVAAHPYYSGHISSIIAALQSATYLTNPLNLRTGVALSSAQGEVGSRGVAQSPSDGQRSNNQDAHDVAIRMASRSHKLLKSLERRHQRIQLFIYKLENNDKKRHLAREYQSELDDLRLTELYAQAHHYRAADKHGTRAARLLTMMDTIDIAGLDKSEDFDLIDLAGKKVVLNALEKRADHLEARLMTAVGSDNFYVEVPYLTQLPGWAKKLLSRYDKDQWPFGEAPEDWEKR